MIVINGLDRLGVHVYIGMNGNILIGGCEDEKGNFQYREVEGASAFLIDDSKGGSNVLIPLKVYEKLRRRGG